jgi:activator of 2-hydroxyglutaryl-CoA dehydratase
MITARIDVGSETIKAVILKDDSILASGIASSEGSNRGQAVERLWNNVLKQAGFSTSDVHALIATGTGKMDVSCATVYPSI